MTNFTWPRNGDTITPTTVSPGVTLDSSGSFPSAVAGSISGLLGKDTRSGGGGTDTIPGREDGDSILGGDRNDSLDGGRDKDPARGGEDAKTILGKNA